MELLNIHALFENNLTIPTLGKFFLGEVFGNGGREGGKGLLGG